MFILWQKSSIK